MLSQEDKRSLLHELTSSEPGLVGIEQEWFVRSNAKRSVVQFQLELYWDAQPRPRCSGHVRLARGLVFVERLLVKGVGFEGRGCHGINSNIRYQSRLGSILRKSRIVGMVRDVLHNKVRTSSLESGLQHLALQMKSVTISS